MLHCVRYIDILISMKNVISTMLLVTGLMLTGCASQQNVKRTLATDPGLRVLIDPRIQSEHYVEIRRALVESGKFEVVERKDGLEVALDEQNLQFNYGSERFDDREKWAHIGRLMGAAAVISAHAQCHQIQNFFGQWVKACRQNLAVIDARTSQVVAVAKDDNEVPWSATGYMVPDWEKAVTKLVEAYPEYFVPRPNSKELERYRDVSQEEARRARGKQQKQIPIAMIPEGQSQGEE